MCFASATVRASGFFDDLGGAVPRADLVAGLTEAEDALMKGVFGQLRIGRILLERGVGFFGEDEVLRQEEAVGGRDAQLGAFRFDAAFGEVRWWSLDEAVDNDLRTIPYRMMEFIEDLVAGSIPDDPIDITPDPDHIEIWHQRR